MFYQALSAGAVALALLTGINAATAAAETAEATHDGTVVSITSTELVMRTKGKKEHTHSLSRETTITLDGRECKAADLKAGLKIRVTTIAADKVAASHIEAISSHRTFANTHDGTIVSITSSKLVMIGEKSKEHSHVVNADTKISCDGKTCKASDLKAGWKIRVTTKKKDQDTALMIEAIDQDSDFS
ncbi:MAG: hypothetical protein ACK526_07235 [Planctomyces sp.]